MAGVFFDTRENRVAAEEGSPENIQTCPNCKTDGVDILDALCKGGVDANQHEVIYCRGCAKPFVVYVSLRTKVFQVTEAPTS
jgi:hypothetical protein